MQIYHMENVSDVHYILELTVSYKQVAQPGTLIIRLPKHIKTTQTIIDVRLLLGGIASLPSKSLVLRSESCKVRDAKVLLNGWFLNQRDLDAVITLINGGRDMVGNDALSIHPLAASLRSAVVLKDS